MNVEVGRMYVCIKGPALSQVALVSVDTVKMCIFGQQLEIAQCLKIAVIYQIKRVEIVYVEM